jgi:hypothetical protein
VNINDRLLERAKALAGQRSVTLGDVVDDSLRNYLAAAQNPVVLPPPNWPTVAGQWTPVRGLDHNSAAALLDYLDALDLADDAGPYFGSQSGAAGSAP